MSKFSDNNPSANTTIEKIIPHINIHGAHFKRRLLNFNNVWIELNGILFDFISIEFRWRYSHYAIQISIAFNILFTECDNILVLSFIAFNSREITPKRWLESTLICWKKGLHAARKNFDTICKKSTRQTIDRAVDRAKRLPLSFGLLSLWSGLPSLDELVDLFDFRNLRVNKPNHLQKKLSTSNLWINLCTKLISDSLKAIDL